MFCKKCGNELSDTSKFCTQCGEEIQPGKKILPASILRRCANFLIDRIAAFIIAMLFIGVGSAIHSTLIVIIGFITLLGGYYVFFEAVFQRTLGKLITKTKVVDMEGKKPTFWRVVGRTFCRLIPFEPLSYLFGGFPIGWHDSISKTLVVPASLTAEEVTHMNIEQVKKEKANNVGGTVVVIIACFFFLVGIVGVLASVVLASLNSARAKGQDAQITATVSNMRVQAEVYRDDSVTASKDGSYAGVCSDEKIYEIASHLPQSAAAACSDSDEAYVITAKLSTGGYVCADNTGPVKKISTEVASTEISCPTL